MFILILIIIIAIILLANIKIVPQARAYVVERLGAYHATWGTGLHITIPILDRIAKKISLKEQVADFPPQPVITKDNVTMQIDTVIYLQVTDPKLYCYGVDNPIKAIENLTATTLRNIIGELELDQTLTSRDIINSKMRVILDEATAYADPENEALIQEAISKLISGKTLIVVAHRLNTIRNADQILVVADGKIAGCGTQNELLENCPLYKEMWENYSDAVTSKTKGES